MIKSMSMEIVLIGSYSSGWLVMIDWNENKLRAVTSNTAFTSAG